MRWQSIKPWFVMLVAVALGTWVVACSDDSSSTSVDNGLAESFPTSFSISSPFADDDSEGADAKRLNKAIPLNTDEDTPEDLENLSEKVEELTELLEATSVEDCVFTLGLSRPIYEPNQCYGPQLDYTDHPDGPPGSNGTLPMGDLGIWRENEVAGTQTVPCVKAKLDELVGKVERRTDFALKAFAAMYCIAKVSNSDSLPGAGATTDFTETMTSNTEGTNFPINITAATMQRTDDCDGNPTYLSRITGTVTDDENTLTVDLNMRHTRESASNDAFSGRIWNSIVGDFGPDGNCGGANKMQVGTSIGYQKLASGIIRTDVQSAEFCSATADPFETDKTIDPANTYAAGTNEGGWAANFNAFCFNNNPSNGTINYLYKWQAGRLDSDSRTLQGEITADSNGRRSGCGYFGYSSNLLTSSGIDKMICNWAGPSNDHTGVEKVQRQCLIENATTGRLESDSSTLNITYAPVNSCDYDGTGAATFDTSPAAIRDGLLPIAQMDFSNPIKPVICGEDDE